MQQLLTTLTKKQKKIPHTWLQVLLGHAQVLRDLVYDTHPKHTRNEIEIWRENTQPS